MASLIENSTTCNSIYYGIIIACVVLLIVYSFDKYDTTCQQRLGFVEGDPTTAQTTAPGKRLGWFEKLKNKGKSLAAKAKQVVKREKKGKLTEGFLEQRQLDENQIQQYEDAELRDIADYAELGDDVYESHRDYVESNYDKSQGPSLLNVERDDTNEVVKRVGLRRVNYTGIFQGDDARTTSSEDAEQVAQKVGTYVL